MFTYQAFLPSANVCGKGQEPTLGTSLWSGFALYTLEKAGKPYHRHW
jgi:hypothetical protein